MSWRRGEVWLDAEVLWFGERVAAATGGGGFASAPVAVPGPPPGLAASRRRRTEWQRRRAARRGWAAVLVLAPAVLVPLGVPRVGQGTGPAAEEPAVLTARAEPPIAPSIPLLAGEAVPADLPPAIDWHRATSLGLPWDGRLLDGTGLPVEAPNWVTWSPITDSVPNAPRRLYGHERTIRAIVSVTAAYRAANPGAPRVVVGDLSREGGGPMTDAHASHQNGLDVDVYYPRRDGGLRAPGAPDEIELRLAQDLVDRFVADGAELVLVGYSTGLRGPDGVVVPYANHENHMHVRFPPPRG